MSPDQQLNLLISRHLDGQLSVEQCAQLAALLKESEEAREEFWQAVHLHHAAAELADQHWGQIGLASAVGSKSDDTADTRYLDAAILSPSTFQGTAPDDAITLRKTFGALAYAGRLSLRQYAVQITGVAAAMLLAFGLLVWIVNRPASLEPEIAQTPDELQTATSSDAQRIMTPVDPRNTAGATLTAEHDVQWAEGALAPGSQLRAGQRLTLTQGFVEITTNDGAIAILQAPATVELTDKNNAIHLHAGKLVGICETESSKGFLVHTPHMDVVDLGTRFGIHVMPSETQVHVFEGQVQATSDAITEPIHLQSGQAVALRSDSLASDAVVAVAAPLQFDAVVSRVIPLRGTGVGLSEGEPDNTWKITEIDGKPLDQPLIPVSSEFEDHKSQRLSGETASHWISVSDPGPIDHSRWKRYTFGTKIDIPHSLQPERLSLRVRFLADNSLVAFRINGHEIDANWAKDERTFFKLYEGTIGSGMLHAGKNDIEIVLNNRPASPTGLLMDWELERYDMAKHLKNAP